MATLRAPAKISCFDSLLGVDEEMHEGSVLWEVPSAELEGRVRQNTRTLSFRCSPLLIVLNSAPGFAAFDFVSVHQLVVAKVPLQLERLLVLFYCTPLIILVHENS